MKTNPELELMLSHQCSRTGIACCRIAVVSKEALARGNCTLKTEELPELVSLHFWWLQLLIAVSSVGHK